MDLIVTILPVVTKDLPISPRFNDKESALSALLAKDPEIYSHVLKYCRHL